MQTNIHNFVIKVYPVISDNRINDTAVRKDACYKYITLSIKDTINIQIALLHKSMYFLVGLNQFNKKYDKTINFVTHTPKLYLLN